MSENVVLKSVLYGNDKTTFNRLSKADEEFNKIFGVCAKPLHFSAPGRTEICGNHTDHNMGKVLAAAVNLDVLAVVSPTLDGIIKLKSEGFNPNTVDSSDLSIHKDETSHSTSLIRGMCKAFIDNGYKVGGFNAYTTSNVLKGSGLSSSAAFEVLVGTILNHLYNDGAVTDVEIAKMAQFAENVYFGKPSGLMDQMASSVGGFVAIDFKDNSSPIIEKIEFDFEKNGYALCITDTKADHADLTHDYTAIKDEMKSIAKYFNKSALREVSEEDFYQNIANLRATTSDRAVLRGIHFFNDNNNVDTAKTALLSNNIDAFLATINASGASSSTHLQNIYSSGNPTSQAASVALAITSHLLLGRGAFRIHGGGFGGTIQAFVPNDFALEYKTKMEQVFGEGSCYILNIRKFGGVLIED
ncbi:MAG: galactokinase family protein [Clostridia bacterium]